MIINYSPRQGIQNDAALCYMTSFIQMLYYLKVFREHIFEDDSNNQIVFELQR